MEVRQVRQDEIRLIKLDMPELNIRYTGRSDSMRALDTDPVWQIRLEYRLGDITSSTYALMGEFKGKWSDRTTYFTAPIPDPLSPLDEISVLGAGGGGGGGSWIDYAVRDEETAVLPIDKGTINVLYDPSDGKYYFARGTAGVPDVNVTGTVSVSVIGTVPVSISDPVTISGTVPVSIAATVPVSIAATVPVSIADPVSISGTVPVSIAATVPVSIADPVSIVDPIDVNVLSEPDNIKTAILKAEDRDQVITYADFATIDERITQIDYFSPTVFSSNIARKTISYVLDSGRYRRTNITWSII
jgi:hypothetical protein